MKRILVLAATVCGLATVLLLMSLTAGGSSSVTASLPLTMVGDIPLPGGASRFDYESIDPQTHKLFIAHLGDSAITVFDTENQKVVANITDVAHVHGVLALPELGRVYASATKTDEVVAIDEKNLQITARIPGGVYPDGMAYAPDVHKLYVSDEVGTTETVIDTNTNRRVATLHLWSVAGNSQYDPVSKHVFVNAQTRDQLVEIDPRTDTIVGRYDLPGADGPHGLLIDAGDRLAFMGCEGNDRLIVFDMKAKRVIASFGVGKDPDVLAFDPGRRWLYVTSEQGVISVFDVARGGVKKIGEGFLGANAHVVAVDAKTHRVYFPLKNVGGHPVLRIMEPNL